MVIVANRALNPKQLLSRMQRGGGGSPRFKAGGQGLEGLKAYHDLEQREQLVDLDVYDKQLRRRGMGRGGIRILGKIRRAEAE